MLLFWKDQSVCFETNFEQARERKINRYAALINDLSDNDYVPNLLCLEIGSRGLITKDNKKV